MKDKENSSKANLISKSISALKWNYIGRLISLLLQFSIGVLLARLLGPEPFGLIAITLFVQSLGNLFADGGLSSALIQCKVITDKDVRSVFSTQILIGVLITLIVIGFAPMLGAFFNEQKAVPVITILALSFTIQALGQTASALIKRNLEFKKIQIISIGSYVIGYLALGLPLAYQNYGVWSLVTAQLCQVSINALATYLSHRHPILPLVNPKDCQFLRFGAAITVNNITSWGIGCIDTAIIGRFFDTATLGLYNRSFNLVNLPAHAIVSSVQSVLLSGYAKTQDNMETVRRTYLASIVFMALIFLPTLSAIASVADSVVLGIYGIKWKEAIPFIPPLSMAIAIHAMLSMTGPMLTGLGKPSYELNAQLITLFFGLPALIFSAQQSIQLLVTTLVGVYALRFLLLTLAAFMALKIPLSRLIKSLIVPIVIACLVSLFAYNINLIQREFQYDVRIRLLVNIVSSAFFYFTCVLILRKFIISGVIKEFIVSIQSKLPSKFVKLIGM